jgi:hypothetical protein
VQVESAYGHGRRSSASTVMAGEDITSRTGYGVGRVAHPCEAIVSMPLGVDHDDGARHRGHEMW